MLDDAGLVFLEVGSDLLRQERDRARHDVLCASNPHAAAGLGTAVSTANESSTSHGFRICLL